ncbi:hypothetical protein EGI26_01820 [Lacihabitans sp. CCS-44]|uniref:hypothetical protein n=1 Tax=Lacihabitans sp. CCS-44 TaxID=2487331 RepID=UPI0020CE1D99|nr:hypothetical protein [Lacihabitans sp. CCS-44]MCP9753898.1 hypothetical protein [Lacihabitans sp. CCS-44]
MSKQHFKDLIFFGLAILALSSCYKEPDFSMTPNIEFASITKDIRLDQFTGAKKDSIIVSVKFQDGDGDLGFNAEEIGSKVPQTDYNYVVKSFRKTKGVFTQFNTFETLSGFYPRLKTDDKIGPIEGTLRYRIEIETAFWPVKKDTVKFEVYIKDRAGNKSNTVETTPIVLNQL